MSSDNMTAADIKHYSELGDRWDQESLADTWDQTMPVDLEVDVQSRVHCYSVDADLSRRLRALAQRHGVSAETLLNLWVQEKMAETVPKTDPAAPHFATAGAAE